jgi:hypothetical protein
MVEPGTPEGSKPKGKRGCFFWGCLGVVVAGLALGGLAVLSIYSLYNLTEPEPRPVPVKEVAPGEYEEIAARLESFVAPAPPAEERLELTADDLNALIAASPDLEELAGRLFIRLQEDRMLLDVSWSVPLERWINATCEARVSLEEGRLKIDVLKAETAAGKELPANLVEGLLHQVLSEATRGKRERLLGPVREIEIAGGRLVLKR